MTWFFNLANKQKLLFKKFKEMDKFEQVKLSKASKTQSGDKF